MADNIIVQNAFAQNRQCFAYKLSRLDKHRIFEQFFKKYLIRLHLEHLF